MPPPNSINTRDMHGLNCAEAVVPALMPRLPGLPWHSAIYAWVSAAESVIGQPWCPTSLGVSGIMRDMHGCVPLSQ